jgi:hypothetical protein
MLGGKRGQHMLMTLMFVAAGVALAMIAGRKHHWRRTR